MKGEIKGLNIGAGISLVEIISLLGEEEEDRGLRRGGWLDGVEGGEVVVEFLLWTVRSKGALGDRDLKFSSPL